MHRFPFFRFVGLPGLLLVGFLAGTSVFAQEPTLTEQVLAIGTEALAELAVERGDPKRGAVLFHQPIFQCAKCHAVGDEESALGPNLAYWDRRPEPKHLVESILQPSKSIRYGYQTVSVITDQGTLQTGILVDRTEELVILRAADQDGKELTFDIDELEDVAISEKSIMPEGLVDQLASKEQFFDLASYVIEIAMGGPDTAAELQPSPEQIRLPPLPAYESSVDHAALIGGFDDDTFDAGERIYNRVCATCHGTHEREGSLPTSPRFASSKLKNGSDPYRLYQTLTHGYGLMVAQRWMVPQQKYAVIHYLREEYFREDNPQLFTKVDDAYLESLPKGDTLGPEPVEYEPWATMDYGPVMHQTFEIRVNPGDQVGRDLGRGPRVRDPWADPDPYFLPGEAPNYAYKGVAIRLDPGPGGVSQGKHWMVYDHDTMNLHAAWSGDQFIDYCCIQFDGQHGVHNRLQGKIHFQNPVGPGWAQPLTGVLHDPRPVGRDGRPYGPLPKPWAKYRGLYKHGDQVVLAYSVGSAEILESPTVVEANEAVGFVRRLSVGPAPHALVMRVAPENVEAQLSSGTDARLIRRDGDWVVTMPASHIPRHLSVIVWDGDRPAGLEIDEPRDLSELTKGGPTQWPERVRTQVTDIHREAFSVEQLALPKINPWNAQVRPTGLDFFADRNRMAVCTWDGDVWLVEGIETGDQLVWQRIASGLFQPLGLKIVQEQIFVTCRDQLVVLRDLNGDNETDFYECFNNDHQVTEHFHEFAMGLQTDDEGNFYYAKSGRHAKRAVVPHHGTLLRVLADGSRTDVLATGFRAANGVCVNPDGTFFVTDQEGHWNPKNRINWVREGGFYGNMYSFTDQLDPSDDAMEQPLCWITNSFDRSPAELLWVPPQLWGPFGGQLLSLSYGYGKVFLVPHESVRGQLQGGMIQLPIPDAPSGLVRGRFHKSQEALYVCGMFSWAGSRQDPGCLQRIRYTGEPAHLPIDVAFRTHEIELTFSHALDEKTASDTSNYTLQTWDLKRTPNYGSQHYNEQTREILGVSVTNEGRTVTLRVPDLEPTWGLAIEYKLRGANGRRVRGEFHGSIHHLE